MKIHHTAVVANDELPHCVARCSREINRVPSLRERQRHRRRDAMLQAAGELFRSRGFAKTTMDNIASDAEVGIATLYNYFGTKEKILVELFRPCLDRSYVEAEKVLTSPPKEPSRGILEVLRCYRHLQEDWNDRSLLRTFASVGIGSAGPVHDLILETDDKLRTQIRSAFDLYAAQGRISEALDLGSATSIIFALFNQFYYQFLQRDDISYQEVFADFALLVPALFEPWERDVPRRQTARASKL